MQPTVHELVQARDMQRSEVGELAHAREMEQAVPLHGRGRDPPDERAQRDSHAEHEPVRRHPLRPRLSRRERERT
jgi:hypothetical protein